MTDTASGASPVSDPTQYDGQDPRHAKPEPAAPTMLGAPAASTPAGSDTSLIDYVSPSSPHLGSGPLVGLEARGVSAWFGKNKVLERVSLNMQPGRVTALIGPSGCGKSTFLRILNRMHEMVAGASLAGEVLLA